MKTNTPWMTPFTCVECGVRANPTHYINRATIYHPTVVESGSRKPGPHCSVCVGKYLKVVRAQNRQKQYAVEAERRAKFDNAQKPPGMSDYAWREMCSYACCPEAKVLGCVCHVAFTCKNHHDIHIGTHD